MLRDGLPEHQDWRDDGCDLSPSCLSCPLPACRYEMPPNRARARAHAAALEELLKQGRTMEQAAADLGVSRHTVYRLRRQWLNQPAKAARASRRFIPLIVDVSSQVFVDGRPACIRCHWAPKMIHPLVAFIETPRGLVCRSGDACEQRRSA